MLIQHKKEWNSFSHQAKVLIQLNKKKKHLFTPSQSMYSTEQTEETVFTPSQSVFFSTEQTVETLVHTRPKCSFSTTNTRNTCEHQKFIISLELTRIMLGCTLLMFIQLSKQENSCSYLARAFIQHNNQGNPS